jgi:hypothetical protein
VVPDVDMGPAARARGLVESARVRAKLRQAGDTADVVVAAAGNHRVIWRDAERFVRSLANVRSGMVVGNWNFLRNPSEAQRTLMSPDGFPR